jgi:D-amino-acid dehydrogenase
VLAAGSSSVAVGRSIRLDIPIEAAMGYSITVRTENNIPLPLMLAESHVVMTPMGDAVRLTSGLDLVGEDRKIDATRIRSMGTAARTYLGLDLGAGTEPWVGFRPLTPDSLPIAGRSTRFSNLFMATGHGTLGVTLAPATGNLVAAILSGQPVPAWTNAVSPARFGI